jgi:DNA repair protein SbcC/Rad50
VRVSVESDGETKRFQTGLAKDGLKAGPKLDPALAGFFAERSYLPQSLLQQLLQIYQRSSSGLDSPLARFVGTLLGLGSLDALEAGLNPVGDVRNIRRIAPDWASREFECDRLNRLLAELSTDRSRQAAALTVALKDLGASLKKLELGEEASEERLPQITALLEVVDDSAEQLRITEQRRHLSAIVTQVETTGTRAVEGDLAQLQETARLAAESAASWHQANGETLRALRDDVEHSLPALALPSTYDGFVQQALTVLTTADEQLKQRLAKADADARRLVAARGELEIVKSRIATIDAEMATIATMSEGLTKILSEISGYILDDVCPVCDRDFSELSKGSLSDHVHAKVTRLSGAAERVLMLGKSRSEQQQQSEGLEREIATLESSSLEPAIQTALVRQDTEISALLQRLRAAVDIARHGDQVEAATVAAQRGLDAVGTRDIALRAARETLTEFAKTLQMTPVSATESLDDAAKRIDLALGLLASAFELRLDARRAALDAVKRAEQAIRSRGEIDKQVADARSSLQTIEAALQRGTALRQETQSIKSRVDAVRSAIIRREFNDRLNAVWRDLFVRLAPSEPFVPAFSVPKSSTRKLQPKLVTLHRNGGQPGGTPGAMLSAGNLNTAALTLFLALHLSVPPQLPWLILDDPVQSMDDIHVAHFAALLRTLSKQHRRQIVVAVHDRQLFDYLRLELSPARPDETLLTLELSRTKSQDTQCLPQWRTYREENRLSAA